MIKREKDSENNDQIIDIKAVRKEKKRRQRKQQSAKDLNERITDRRVLKKRRRRLIYGSVLLILVVVIGLSVFNLISLKMEKTLAESELESLKKERATLKEELKHVDSNDYIEQQARKELNMILPGETLYVLEKEEKEIGED